MNRCRRLQAALNGLRQFLLPFDPHKRVLAGHLDLGVAGDLGHFNRGSADFLAPGDVRAAEGAGVEALEIVADGWLGTCAWLGEKAGRSLLRYRVPSGSSGAQSRSPLKGGWKKAVQGPRRKRLG